MEIEFIFYLRLNTSAVTQQNIENFFAKHYTCLFSKIMVVSVDSSCPHLKFNNYLRGDLSAWGAIVWRDVLIFFLFRITCLPQASRFVSLQFWFQNGVTRII